MKILVCASILILIGQLAAFSGEPKEPSRESLLLAPTGLEISGQYITFSAYIWRDFMPNSPADGKPMRAAIKFFSPDHSPLRTNFSAKQIWVIQKDKIWNEPLQAVGRGLPPLGLTTYEVQADHGPKWLPGGEVVVVVQIQTDQGKYLLMGRKKQKIEKTQ